MGSLFHHTPSTHVCLQVTMALSCVNYRDSYIRSQRSSKQYCFPALSEAILFVFECYCEAISNCVEEINFVCASIYIHITSRQTRPWSPSTTVLRSFNLIFPTYAMKVFEKQKQVRCTSIRFIVST